ncbi:unnamed protein product [Rhizoctonia solani]|uniref:Uncharacterized protein n=1 Tax=Rhizoctonia solani TaxID=456999 RepID=A0A8H3H0S5_9AGAM|nr:unnamed protein product [Rhizoctonia solani]
MLRSNRTKPDSCSRSPENTRKKLESVLRNESTDKGLPWPFKSPTNFSSNSSLRMSRLNTSEEWLDFAQKTIWESATVTDAIQILAAEPYLLEFLITANEDIRDSVYEFVCAASFPTKCANWAVSTSCYFLQRFQVYLSRLPPHLADRNIDDASRHTSALVSALSALDHVTFQDGGAQEEEDEPEDIIIKVKSKKSQKQRKANKASHARNKSIVADPRLFTAVDIDLPVTADEVLVTEICILERIQETLKVFMTAFDNPNLAPHAKALFFKQPLQYEPVRLAPKPNTTLVEDKIGNATGPEVGAYPHIRPLAAAKYFDEGTGLGAWNIIVSGRAIKDLRQIQKGDSHVFGMLYKKIMELSQGFFSDDNQKRLLGLDTEVPIYEAKVSRDLRIVYQIDLDTDVDAKSSNSMACTHTRNWITGSGLWSHIITLIVEERSIAVDVSTAKLQVFVTQSRVLAQRVQEYYQRLVRSSFETVGKDSGVDEQDEEVLADLDDEDASTFGLPIKYSMLEEKHFPLFVTYDQLCSLLEVDFGLQFRRTARTKVHAAAEKRFTIAEVADVKIDPDREVEVESSATEVVSPTDTKEDLQQARRAAVTFEIFVAAYWPHFDFRLTVGLDPALVYSEFLGIIEGSELPLQSPTGALSRDEYTSLSHRKSSFASQRYRVYDLYELYRKRKQFLGGYDYAERTHALVNALNLSVPGSKIDCLYVDEAQDNLLIDTILSNNPHGIFMAGDTAQTISAGSSFRFEDLKAFLWRLEVYPTLSHRRSVIKTVLVYLKEQDEAVRCGKRNAIHPALFHLAVNYRSHGGIVDCASSVVQLISDLFPYSIDKLSKETGLIDGPKPLFFSGWDRDVVRFEQFLQGEADTRIDFGASQVILVRNEAARAALRTQVGEIGLILTLYASKGLEFDDVLLYNFFEDSVPSASTWRVILHGLEAARLGPVPRFDVIRHAVICTELNLQRLIVHTITKRLNDELFTRKALRMRGNEEPTPGSGCKKSMKLFLRIFLRLEMFSALIRLWFRSWIVPPVCFLVGVNTGSLQLGYRVQRKIFEGYVSKLHACDLVRSELTMVPPHSERSIVHDLVDYYGEQTEYALHGALVAIQHIVTRSLNIELNVLVHLLESIGRDIIMHGRAHSLYQIDMSAPNRSQAWADMREKALDGLLVPRSWALDIIQKPAKKVQNGWEVLPFLEVLYEVLRRLKFEEDSGFYLFNGRMGIILRGIMSLRVCRLLYLIGDNLVYHPQHKDKIRVRLQPHWPRLLRRRSTFNYVAGKPKLSRTTSWPDLFSALAESPLNRGADEFIRLSFRHSKLRPRRLMHVRLIVYENIKPELERALSFVTFNTARGPALNPEAKPFVLNQRSTDETTETSIQDPADRQDGDGLPEAETDDTPSDDIFGGLVPAQLAFRMPPAAKPERKFTEDERRAGLCILGLYRKHLSRKHMRERHAVRIIWVYYTRHRRRTQVVSGSNEDSIRQFHLDYRRIVDDIECPLLLDRLHRLHTMVLQGPMPHVLVFLRGLEQITQVQKAAVKKRLQKVQHEELEKVQSRMTLCTSLAKQFKKLIPSIQPDSKALRSLTALKDKVSEVDAMRDAIVEGFGEGCISANLELHYSLGVKVILMPSPEPTAPKPPKPELNTSDMDGLF